MKNKKLLCVLLIIVFVIIICFCILFIYDKIVWKEVNINLDPEYNELFTEEEMEIKGHENLLPEYISNVSVAYGNNDGTKTLYVFSSPIVFQDTSGAISFIDIRINNVENEEKRADGYLYTVANNDVIPFFPKELNSDSGILIEKDISYQFGIESDNSVLGWYENRQNFINESKNMVVYKNFDNQGSDISVYPSNLGVNCEMNISQPLSENIINFWLKLSDENIHVEKEPGGYLVLTLYGNIVGVIQKPILKDKTGNIYYDCKVDFVEEDDGIYSLKFDFGESVTEDFVAYISFEMRKEKQPDNALYSNLPDLENAYLCNYSVIGNNFDYGLGRLLIRYEFTRFFRLKASQIEKAEYYTYSLTNNTDQLEMLSMMEEWCSRTGNWNENYKTGLQTSLFELKDHELNFDITDEVKKWCEDPYGQLEYNGVMLKSLNEEDDIFNVILSNDNALYRNRTEIILK